MQVEHNVYEKLAFSNNNSNKQISIAPYASYRGAKYIYASYRGARSIYRFISKMVQDTAIVTTEDK